MDEKVYEQLRAEIAELRGQVSRMEERFTEELMDIRERLGRIESKVELLMKTRVNSNRGNSQRLVIALFTAWLSFLSIVLGWLALAR